jgi:hypothetical protein
VWLQAVQDGYQQDPKAQQMLTGLLLKSDSIPHFTLTDGILRYKNRVWVGDNNSLQQHILQVIHSSALGGYSGFPMTYRKLKQLFAWQGMKTSAKSFVQSCVTCQQAKPNRARYPGLLSPLPVSEGAWQTISLDFIEGLPKSGTANCILVVVDNFSKYSNFVPLHHPFTTASLPSNFCSTFSGSMECPLPLYQTGRVKDRRRQSEGSE